MINFVYNELMSRVLKNVLAAVLVLIGVLILYFVYSQSHKVDVEKKSELSSLLSGVDGPLHLDEQIKSSDCHLNGPLPDHGCTPGAVFSDVAKEIICVQGYTRTVRSVPLKLKKKLYAEYGVAYPPDYGTYELDHLIPLEIGGSNDEANLFSEASQPTPGFKEKDIVENYLHQEVCAGRVALAVAQEKIAEDWLAIYNNLDPKTIEEMKAKYRSWAK